MQTVTAAFTVEEKDSVRKIADNFQVSWHKQSTVGNRTFTIGISTIGGTGVIGINPGAIGSPGNYKYFDESTYVQSLSWERALKMPTGGLNMSLADATLDNTSGRFTPRVMGGRSELFTAIVPRRPATISAGFNFGTDITIPQFAGIITRQPSVDIRGGQLKLVMSDYVDFFQGKYLDDAIMFTSKRTDQVLGTLFAQLGMSTAQYDLDYGINRIDFGLFPQGSKFSDIIGQLVEAENAQLYQDESGVFKFENRQHWDSAPYTQVQKVITTSQVLNASIPSDDHIINIVEVQGSPRALSDSNEQISGIGGGFGSEVTLLPPGNTDVWINYNDPIFTLVTPVPNGTAGQSSYYVANTLEDASGIDYTSSIYIKTMQNFAQASKITFVNPSSVSVFLTTLDIWGRPARKTGDIYFRDKIGASVTAYEEKTLNITNDYIQNSTWAQSYAGMILNDFARPENLQTITIRAIPELQLGDLVSWQGRLWRIYDIKSTLDASSGYIQELTMLQRTITSYFRIGIATIGGSSKIAP